MCYDSSGLTAKVIGTMDNPDKYAMALTRAMDKNGIKNVQVAKAARVGSNNVTHWRAGRRPVPADRAIAVATLLGVSPATISKAYDLQHRTKSTLKVPTLQMTEFGPCPEGHLVIQQLEGFGRNDGPGCLWLPEFMIRREIGMIEVENLRWTVQPSRTMEPVIKRQSLILIDVTVSMHEDVLDGGIYAYTLFGRPDIRRIATHRDGWTLTGLAPEVERTVVARDELQELRVYGAVIGWL
jgi:DNA-binding transcriptional regulator YdaS (Cro superfamily)